MIQFMIGFVFGGGLISIICFSALRDMNKNYDELLKHDLMITRLNDLQNDLIIKNETKINKLKNLIREEEESWNEWEN